MHHTKSVQQQQSPKTTITDFSNHFYIYLCPSTIHDSLFLCFILHFSGYKSEFICFKQDTTLVSLPNVVLC